MKSSKEKIRSLIMCVTPLQMLIAERIIESNSDEEFDLIVLALNDNEKYRYYYQRLKVQCSNSLYIVTEPKLKGFMNYVKQLKANNLIVKYESLYLASIDSRHFQYIISKNETANIYTFDDGTANIIYNSSYYSDGEPVFWKKAMWYCIGIRHYMKDIKEKSLIHYTIYKDLANIVDNTKPIRLYEESKQNNTDTDSVVRIYLGQPLQEFPNNFDDYYILSTLEKLKIDYYYPHPREKNIPTGNFIVIESFLVFEDYIVDFLKNNSDLTVEVYSFISTAIINVASLDRVNVKYIYNDCLYEKHRDFYDFINNDLKIELLNLDS